MTCRRHPTENTQTVFGRKYRSCYSATYPPLLSLRSRFVGCANTVALNGCLYGSDPRERRATAQATLQLPSGYMQPVNAKRSRGLAGSVAQPKSCRVKIVQRRCNETDAQPLTERHLANAPPFGEGILAWVTTKDRKSMNHLLGGTAFAAALAIAAPVWAQTAAPVTPASPAPAAAVPAKAAAAPAAPITTSASHKQMLCATACTTMHTTTRPTARTGTRTATTRTIGRAPATSRTS
jgi:hypothetical protein